jgi:cytolethal distending toxin subunit B
MNIVTWNMQGSNHSEENKWNYGVKNILTNVADLICLQECGSVPLSAKLIDNNFSGVANLMYFTWGTERKNYHILFYPADPNGNRCNLAVVSHNAPAGGCIVYPLIPPIWRPSLGFQMNDSSFLFSIHAISPNGPDVHNLLQEIENTYGNANRWVVAGDFNRDPGTLVVPNAIKVCPPNNNTYSVNHPIKKLDYCVKNFGFATQGNVLTNLILSDHYPVAFNI